MNMRDKYSYHDERYEYFSWTCDSTLKELSEISAIGLNSEDTVLRNLE